MNPRNFRLLGNRGNPTEKRADRFAARAWIGRRRRVGFCAWGSKDDVPLTSYGRRRDTWVEHAGVLHEFRDPDAVQWVRIPGTRLCVGTYKRRKG